MFPSLHYIGEELSWKEGRVNRDCETTRYGHDFRICGARGLKDEWLNQAKAASTDSGLG